MAIKNTPVSYTHLDVYKRQVKIHQAHYNFPVNDQRAFPFYRKCAELGIPAAFHTGFSLGRTIDRLIPTMPLLLDELAYDCLLYTSQRNIKILHRTFSLILKNI